MPEPELTVRNLTPPVPVTVCESGRHITHSGDTCEDVDALQAAFRAYFTRVMAEAFEEAEQVWLHGNGAGEMRGVLTAEKIRIPYPLSEAEIADHGIIVEHEPTPVERAFAILAPHLDDVPLYRPGWKA